MRSYPSRASMRSLRRIWSDKKPFNRRCRWYEGDGTGPSKATMPYRLEFTDEHGQCNRFFMTVEAAERWYKRFAELCDEIPHPSTPAPSPATIVRNEIDAEDGEGK